MSNEIQIAAGRFGLEIATQLLVAQVMTGAAPKDAATKMIGDVLTTLSGQVPELAPHFQQIAASVLAQIELGAIDADRLRKGKGN